MIELRNVELELDRFRGRLFAAAAFVLLGFALLGARLVWLQIWKHEELQTQAEANRIAVVPIVPNRGLILDRNGIVLATNFSAYTLEITPSKLDANVDAVLDQLAQVIDIQPRDRRRYKRLLEDSKSFESLPIRTKLSDEEVARFMAQRFRFPGVDVHARLFRHYPLGETGSPPDRLHRPHQPGREEADRGVGRRSPGQLQGHRIHRQARPRAEPTKTSCTASPASRRSRPAPAAAPCGAWTATAPTPGNTLRAVGRHQAAGAGRRDVRRAPRRAGGDRPAQRRGAGAASASRPSTPTCSSTASTSTTGAS